MMLRVPKHALEILRVSLEFSRVLYLGLISLPGMVGLNGIQSCFSSRLHLNVFFSLYLHISDIFYTSFFHEVQFWSPNQILN